MTKGMIVMKELETERLRLRKITRDDVQTIYDNWANDPEVTKYLTWNAHSSIDDTNAIMEFWLEEYKNDNCYRYGIERKSDNELMGMIDVVGFHHGNPVIGYCSGRKFWNCGYMTEALQAVIQQLFSDGYTQIVIEAIKENIGSNRVITKAGFKFVAAREDKISSLKPQTATIYSYRLYKDQED